MTNTTEGGTDEQFLVHALFPSLVKLITKARRHEGAKEEAAVERDN